MTEPQHVPVLLDRVMELLAPVLAEPGAVLVDATLGLGGHTEAVLERHPDVHVVGIDRDPVALSRSRERLAAHEGRVTFVEAVFDSVGDALQRLGLPRVHAVLFDLGVSSMQLDMVERGFSYSKDAPLDMRMDPQDAVTAADVVNTYSVDALTRILRDYGEERFARRIAEAIVQRRSVASVRTSADLVDVVRASIPAAARRTGGNPAKRTFQALRIEVNDELSALRRALPTALESVCVGGRIVVLAYHSLEDRIVKQCFGSATTTDAPPDLPVVPPELRPQFRRITRGAEVASPDETARNPRAQSVRLRAVERIGEAA